MTTIERRRAVENRGYRLVEEGDIVAGMVIEMVERESVQIHPQYPTDKIRLDENPIRDRDGIPYVFYHCIDPAWDDQCFVPLAYFIGKSEDMGSDHFNYWLPYDS
jgi:hypothetical protein